MNGRRQFVVLGLAATVLLLALALQFVRLRDVQRGDITTPPRPIGLRARIPLALPGWTGRDEPLGPTESVNRAVAQNLNFDEVCHRRYEKSGVLLGVYVAYWSAGRMPLQKVASHTPDRCWSESGWTCTDARFPVVLSTVDDARWAVGGEDGNRKADSGNLKPEARSSVSSGLRFQPSALALPHPSAFVALKPAYWRTFTPPGGKEPTHVLYWHLVGDELYDYGGGFNRRPRLVNWWRDMLRYAFAGSREQFFVRLTCDRPFEELEADAGFQAIVEALGGLGLKDDERWTGDGKRWAVDG